ncbi:hypothetical protein E6P09_02615 [Haloferax mediterranei ATCC 33500]|uniref:Uncharacterized protein n=1 Tax=Haloferax mediterranei (strain ATCC 33500 / DSM 1411 / JCM 8866 / NBRC 14739 / NCIMB 2177 / R-4) TaxID=523841 RepID=I3R8P1_HALMT|nr:hypothetical protein C439_10870 [Haloferax mediterranei ATCC 33500]QCQ74219.1 hypothetical protein E6P09_02615 [Haloferax mediterranei ATCC 33500]
MASSVFGTETLQFDTDVESTPDVQLTMPDPEEVDGDDANENHPLEIPHVEDAAVVLEAFGVNQQSTQGADGND